MANYYVASTGSNTSPYDTWAKAATTFAAAVTAATGNGDFIYVDQGFTDTLTTDTAYTFGNNIRVICSNDKVNEPPQTLGVMGTSAWIGHSTTNYGVVLNGAYKVYIYGITLRVAGSGLDTVAIASSDGSHFELENCYLWLNNTSDNSAIIFGASSNINGIVFLLNCTFRFGATGQKIRCQCPVDILGGSISSSGSAPTTLFEESARFGVVSVNGLDLSLVTGTLLATQATVPMTAVLANCKLGSGVTPLASQTPANKSSGKIWIYNCSGADQHYHLQHHDAFGSTIIDTGIYANDGASYDGTNRCSWKIVTTANCSYYTPYVSPWIDCYHSGTSAIAPSLEIVRSGSATAYQDDEVWAEFSYQGTSGFPLATIISDRKALLASAADQTTGALGASDWTGENATSWFGKLNPTSAITPAEIGHLRARVCVGEPSITVYVDPTIRGQS